MNIADTLKKIKAIFEDVPPVVAPVEFKEYSLADGSVVKIDKLEAGGKVTINELPAAAAEYTLADGSTFTTDETGSIVEVKPKEPAVEPVGEAMTVNSFNAFKEEKEKELDALKDELKTIKSGFNQLVEVIEGLTKTPAADPIMKESFMSEQKKTKDEMFGQMQKALQALKK